MKEPIITAYSRNRYRAHAADQRKRGLKVGGTVTEFGVSDGAVDMVIEAWGATPGERRTNAIQAFRCGCNTDMARIISTHEAVK